MRINSARQIVNILPLISLLLETVVVIFASFAHKQDQQWVETHTHTMWQGLLCHLFIHPLILLAFLSIPEYLQKEKSQ